MPCMGPATAMASSQAGEPAAAHSARIHIRSPKNCYGREFEKDRLGRVLKREPGQGDILLILGPSDCGKTTFLKSFLEGTRHVLYVHRRGIDSRSPMTFTSAPLIRLLPIAPSNQQQKLRELPSDSLPSATRQYFSEVFETLKCVTLWVLVLRRQLQRTSSCP